MRSIDTVVPVLSIAVPSAHCVSHLDLRDYAGAESGFVASAMGL